MAIILVPCSESQGRSSFMKCSTPGFCSPTALSIPPGVSVTRGGGLPGRSWRVVPLQLMPPSSERG